MICRVLIIVGGNNPVIDTQGGDYCNMVGYLIDKKTSEESRRLFSKHAIDNIIKFPGDPACYVNGKIIPLFITCSSSSGITFEIITNTLK